MVFRRKPLRWMMQSYREWRHQMKVGEFTRLNVPNQVPLARIRLCWQMLDYLGRDALMTYQPSVGVVIPLVAPHPHMDETIRSVDLWTLCFERNERVRSVAFGQALTNLESYLITSENFYALAHPQYQAFYDALQTLFGFLISFTEPEATTQDLYHLRLLSPFLGTLTTTLLTLVTHKTVL